MGQVIHFGQTFQLYNLDELSFQISIANLVKPTVTYRDGSTWTILGAMRFLNQVTVDANWS